MSEDTIYFDFFIHSMHFTCEDYSDTTYAIYHEGMFVAELDECDYQQAVGKAVDYYKKCAYMGITV